MIVRFYESLGKCEGMNEHESLVQIEGNAVVA